MGVSGVSGVSGVQKKREGGVQLVAYPRSQQGGRVWRRRGGLSHSRVQKKAQTSNYSQFCLPPHPPVASPLCPIQLNLTGYSTNHRHRLCLVQWLLLLP